MEKIRKVGLSTEQVVSKNVSAYRFMLGLDYQRFAERAHLAPERIAEIEKGKDVLKNGIELLRIAEAHLRCRIVTCSKTKKQEPIRDATHTFQTPYTKRYLV